MMRASSASGGRRGPGATRAAAESAFHHANLNCGRLAAQQRLLIAAEENVSKPSRAG